MIVIRLLSLVISLGLINAFVLSWGIVNISQLYEIPYLNEFGFWNILGLALLKGVLEGSTRIELGEIKIGIQGEEVSEEQISRDIVVYFMNRMIMIAASVGVARLIYWIYL